METYKKIDVSLDEANKWFNSGNATLKEIALKAFSKDELIYNFKDITTFKKACKALGFDYDDIFDTIINIVIFGHSKASAAMFKLNIIRKALNLGQDLHLTKNPENSYIYYTYNTFITESSTYYEDDINSGRIEIIGKIKSEGKEYNVLGGFASSDGLAGFGSFDSRNGVGYTSTYIGFLGCTNKEIAKHLGKYFGMLITEAKYGDLPNFEIVEDKYGNV